VNSDCIIPGTLAIELTLQDGEVGVTNANGEVLIQSIQSSSRETDDVLPAIDALMKKANLKPSELSLIALSIGPSGFTTMRIATTIAKHISFITDAPIVAVPSAISAAASQSECELLLSIEAVKGNSFWLSQLSLYEGAWKCDATLTTIDAVKESSFTHQGILCNPQHAEIARVFNVPILPYAPSAKSLMIVSSNQFNRGETISAAALTPLYPREPEAVRKWKTQRNAR